MPERIEVQPEERPDGRVWPVTRQTELRTPGAIPCVLENRKEKTMYPTTDLARWRLALELATMQTQCDCLLEEKETERERLLEQAKAGRSRLWERFLLRAGDVLISSGLWLT